MDKTRAAKIIEAAKESKNPVKLNVPDERKVKKKFGGKQEGSGRPLLPIKDEDVYKLALIHCTQSEIASVLNCSLDVIKERFSSTVHKGWEDGQMSLKRKMHSVAMEGDTKMLIWISKQRLGYKDIQPEEATQVHFNVYTNEVPK